MTVPPKMRVAVLSDSTLPRIDGVSYSVESLTVGLIRRGLSILRILPRLSERSHGTALAVDVRPLAVTTPLDKYPFTFVTARHIRRLLGEFRPDVISVQTLGPIGVAGVIAARALHVPYVLAWHTDFEKYQAAYPLSSIYLIWSAARLRSLPANEQNGREFLMLSPSNLLSDLLQRLASDAIAVTVPSLKAARQVRGFSTKPPLFVMPTGVSRSELELPDKSTHEEAQRANWGRHAMLYVGRLSREKNIPFLLDALRVVLRTHDDAKLILVGPCHDRRLRRQIHQAAKKYTGGVIYLGAIPRNRLADIYRSASIFVTASVSDTQSLAVWEARLMGLPIVALDQLFSESFPQDAAVSCTKNDVYEFAAAVNQFFDFHTRSECETDLIRPASDELAEMFVEAVLMSSRQLYFGILFEWNRSVWKPVSCLI
jgi:1,2-diacylglycerol 3-alpha-glucosyltransferase